MAFKLSELDGELGEVISSITSQKPMILLRERKEDYQVWVEPDYLHIQDLKINIFSAEYHKYNKDTGNYEIDHDLYYFFNARSGRFVYSEYGSSLWVCVHNYCNESGKQIDRVEDLLCVYKLDDGKFLRKKVLTRDKL